MPRMIEISQSVFPYARRASVRGELGGRSSSSLTPQTEGPGMFSNTARTRVSQLDHLRISLIVSGGFTRW